MSDVNMQIQEKQVTQIKITGAKNLDPITVYIDEWQDEKYKGCCDTDVRYQGRIIILCYGMALNYFWNAMESPMREFFITASTGYIADKFELNARETFKPQAYGIEIDDFDNLKRVQMDNVEIEVSEQHRGYICRIIEAVKDAFRQQLNERKNGNI